MSRRKIFFTFVISFLILNACQETGPQTEPEYTASPPVAVVEPPETVDTPTSEPLPTETAVSTEEPATSTPEPEFEEEPTATEVIITTEAKSEDMTILASDGLEIAATLSTPAGSTPFPGVMLLHMLGDNRKSWENAGFEQALVDAGYAVLSIDMRGHGETGGDIEWTLAGEDLNTVWETFAGLDSVDGENTAVVGASMGSNMSLKTGVDIPAIKTVILLSPGLEYADVNIENDIVDFGQRPLLIVASEEDLYSAQSSETLYDLAGSKAEIIMLNGAGHGTSMLFRDEDLTGILIDWLNNNLQ